MHSTPPPTHYEAAHAPYDRDGAWERGDYVPPPVLRAAAGQAPAALARHDLKPQLDLPDDILARFPGRHCAPAERGRIAMERGAARGSKRTARLNWHADAPTRLGSWLAQQPATRSFSVQEIIAAVRINRTTVYHWLGRYRAAGAVQRVWGWVGPRPKSFGHRWSVIDPAKLPTAPADATS